MLFKFRVIPSVFIIGLLACGGSSKPANTGGSDVQALDVQADNQTADTGYDVTDTKTPPEDVRSGQETALPQLDAHETTGPDTVNPVDTPIGEDITQGEDLGQLDTENLTDTTPPLPTIAVVNLWPLDIWARHLQNFQIKMLDPQGNEVALSGDIPRQVRITEAGKYKVTLSAPDYDSAQFYLWVDAVDGKNAVRAQKGDDMKYQGLSVAHRPAERGGDGPAWVHDVYIGLRSHYFAASGRAPTRGNSAQLLMDGEEAWAKVKDVLDNAKSTILLSTWWWQSDFELYRPKATHTKMTKDERWKNTIFYVLTHSAAYKRVLVGQFWSQDGFLDWLNTDKYIKGVAEDPDDDFEFMGQANPSEGKFTTAIPGVDFVKRVSNRIPGAKDETFDASGIVPADIPPHETDMTDFPSHVTLPIASYHQKFIVVDMDQAFVGGMNVKSTDWDTHQHLVFEPRRMKFDSSNQDRQDVADKKSEPDLGPRKDYMVYMQGPAALDAARVFHKRWKYQLDQGVDYSENSSDFTVPDTAPKQPDDVEIQVTATLPKPLYENSIWESQVNAVRHAEHFIYIEDQYFRAPLLFNAIKDRMLEKPDIVLIVVTKPINEWTDPGCAWTYKSNLLFKDAVADRYVAVQLRSFDTHVTWGIDETDAVFKDMDVHSKMLIVDDKYMSVGSCNKNNRGLLYEGEMNVSILNRQFVRAAIKRIFSNLLGQTVDTTDPHTLFNLVKQEAAANKAVWDLWDAEGFDLSLDGKPLPDSYKPVGFVYPLPFNPVSKCLIESIGPDVMMPAKSGQE